VSGNGRYVAFYSGATNLVPGDTNGVTDVFVRDTWLNVTERVSVAPDGTQANGQNVLSFGAPAISADGRYVAFVSSASNLVPDDTNAALDVFVRDRVAGMTARVSVASDGAQANADSNLAVWNSVGINDTGRYVVFASSASNLVPGDTNKDHDLFLRDTIANTTERVNLTPAGEQSERGIQATFPSISADGRYVAFDSSWDLTLPRDQQTNQIRSFVRDRVAPTTLRLPGNSLDGDPARMDSNGVQVSADGRYVTFTTYVTPRPVRGAGGAGRLRPGPSGRRSDAHQPGAGRLLPQ
jgi:Tol biopolymer transport system component